MEDILIIGHKGYIGSCLYKHLSNDFNVSGVDLCWFSKPENAIDYKTLTRSYLSSFKSIILLAGHSSVRQCLNNRESSFKNNVDNFVNILEKIEDQKFIYASSSSVYGRVLAKEEYGLETLDRYISENNYDLSKYIIDQYAKLSNKQYYGLRLGTVSGYSSNLRIDLMINAMVNSAIENGYLKVFEGHINRPILGINDLSRAVLKILKTNSNNSGIYNLASFNSTSMEIAKKISEIMNCEIIEVTSENKGSYDFKINSNKFQRTFDFNFDDNIESIVYSLKKNMHLAQKSMRDKGVKYV